MVSEIIHATIVIDAVFLYTSSRQRGSCLCLQNRRHLDVFVETVFFVVCVCMLVLPWQHQSICKSVNISSLGFELCSHLSQVLWGFGCAVNSNLIFL